MNTILANRIRLERESQSLSQEQLAEKLGLAKESRQTISAWESGKRKPSLDLLEKLSDLFECDLDYLTGRYECKTRGYTDVNEKTGLSEEAIKTLSEIKNKQKTVLGSAKIMLLNAMLEDVAFLENAAYVLYALHMIPEESIVEISFHDKNGAANGSLISNNSDDLRRLYMADLQNIIFSFINRQFQK